VAEQLSKAGVRLAFLLNTGHSEGLIASAGMNFVCARAARSSLLVPARSRSAAKARYLPMKGSRYP
jgi:hypothetical protein